MKIQVKEGTKVTDFPLEQLPAEALITFGQLFGMLDGIDQIINTSFELYMEHNDKYIVIGKKK